MPESTRSRDMRRSLDEVGLGRVHPARERRDGPGWVACAWPGDSQAGPFGRKSLLTLAAGGIGDDYLDALDLLEAGVAGRGHRPAQRAHQVHRAVGNGRRAVQDLLQGADGADPDAGAAGEFGVVGLAPPVV